MGKSSLAVACAAIIAVLLGACAGPSTSVDSKPQSSLRRIMETRELRCGYTEWPKLVERDPESGSLRGAYADYIEELGKLLRIKINWAQEVPFADMAEALNSGKVDAICAGIWPTGERAPYLTFTNPIARAQVKAYVRTGDRRFDGDLDAINADSVTVVTIDGELSSLIHARRFPRAAAYALPKMSDGPQVLLALAHGKADVAFTDPVAAHRYRISNPASIQEVKLSRPVAAFGLTTDLRKGDYELKETLDVATEDLRGTGVIDAILKRYQEYNDEFLPVD